ncbi:MAG: hypothetical protein KDA58_02480, partial [Planctomycetaceae bacterium]|nr:hypothetical protein [Planctomycetaceae bacterium]
WLVVGLSQLPTSGSAIVEMQSSRWETLDPASTWALLFTGGDFDGDGSADIRALNVTSQTAFIGHSQQTQFTPFTSIGAIGTTFGSLIRTNDSTLLRAT